uniref:Mediator of RNA polymerase II transcription subunit 8 n=1 Tax=Petromyzon marinus TaxID=7757 RepID=S4RXP2_PETMA
MQREEKVLELCLESLTQRVSDLKNSLEGFIRKLETQYETLNWPSMLDSFALLSGQLNSLNKLLRNDKTPCLRGQIIMPLLLSPDRDDELMKMTEGRVPVFSHDVVPDHLRTKPDPAVEEQEKQMSLEAARLTPDMAQKHMASMNKMCNSLLDRLNSTRDDRDGDSSTLRHSKHTFNPADTNALVAAVGFGKGLSRPGRPPSQGGTVQPGLSGPGGPVGCSTVGQGGPSGAMVQQQQQQQQQQMQSHKSHAGKMPSSIKTNIKSASNVHPYQR